MADSFIRCKKCRLTIIPENNKKIIVNCHGEEIANEEVNSNSCTGLENLTLFIKEENMPDWMEPYVQEANWTKGRILCPSPNCQARIGSFDFVSGQKCSCQENVLPAVRIVSSKVDVLRKTLPALH